MVGCCAAVGCCAVVGCCAAVGCAGGEGFDGGDGAGTGWVGAPDIVENSVLVRKQAQGQEQGEKGQSVTEQTRCMDLISKEK